MLNDRWSSDRVYIVLTEPVCSDSAGGVEEVPVVTEDYSRRHRKGIAFKKKLLTLCVDYPYLQW